MAAVAADVDAGAAAAVTANADQALAESSEPKKQREERLEQICLFLSERVAKNGRRLERGTVDAAAEKFQYTVGGMRTIWSRYKQAILHPDKHILDVRRKKGTGCKAKWTAAQVRAAVGRVPCQYRHSIRSLAEQTGIPYTTLQRYLKKDVVPKESAKEEERRQVPSTLQSDLQLNKVKNEIKERYEREKAEAVKEAKREARAAAERKHNLLMEKLRGDMQQQKHQMEKLRGDMQQQKHQMEKLQGDMQQQKQSHENERDARDKAIYKLKEDMSRHQLEHSKLKADLDRIQNGGSGGEVKGNEKEVWC